MKSPKYHVFVCISSKLNGQQKGLCHSKQSQEVIARFMECIDENDLSDQVMVTSAGCMGICSQGPIVVIYPEGTWYGGVTPEDVEEIVESHFENGEKIGRLLI